MVQADQEVPQLSSPFLLFRLTRVGDIGNVGDSVDKSDLARVEPSVSESISFIINGTQVTLARRDVERAMRGISPEPIRNLAVDVAGTRYPVKQVFERVTGLDRLDFTSATARRHLANLGFAVSRTS